MSEVEDLITLYFNGLF